MRVDNKHGEVRYRTDCKACRLRHGAARRYAVSAEFIIELEEKQNNTCAICHTHLDDVTHGANTRLVIDHCHTTGKVRGLLCNYCNTVIGMAKEDEQILLNAIAYLKEHT